MGAKILTTWQHRMEWVLLNYRYGMSVSVITDFANPFTSRSRSPFLFDDSGLKC